MESSDRHQHDTKDEYATHKIDNNKGGSLWLSTSMVARSTRSHSPRVPRRSPSPSTTARRAGAPLCPRLTTTRGAALRWVASRHTIHPWVANHAHVRPRRRQHRAQL
uniref:Uncharacterized protein n=1 Tax=Oryza glaberrima TaxID=4538 RepID=I1QP84_ORYGL